MAWYNYNDALNEQFGNDWMQSIYSYYGGNSDIWKKVGYDITSETTYQEIANALQQMKQVQPMRAIDGTHMGVDYNTSLPFKDPTNLEFIVVNDSDSNSAPSMFMDDNVVNKMPSNITLDENGYKIDSGVKVVSSGDTLAAVADTVKLARAGVEMGAKLGVAIDESLYNSNPQFWDDNFPTVNPETWNSLVGESVVGDYFLRELFGIDTSNGKAQAYHRTDAMVTEYKMLRDLGAFASTDKGATSQLATNIPQPIRIIPAGTHLIYKQSATVIDDLVPNRDFIFYKDPGSAFGYKAVFYSDSDTTTYTITQTLTINGVKQEPTTNTYTTNQSSFKATAKEITVHYRIANIISFATPQNIISIPDYYEVAPDGASIWTCQFGQISEGGYEGISKMPSESAPYGVPDPAIINGTSLSEIESQLRQNYPQLFEGEITENVLQPDGSIKSYSYVPTPTLDPSQLTSAQPTTEDVTQNQPQIPPDSLYDIINQFPKTPNPPDTGEGSAPGVVLPTGSASSLWAVYHPTQAQLSAFGAWLWSSDFVEQIKRLFNDPMQAVIGVHKVFAPIPTGATRTIVCGYLDSGVSSATVSSQYTEVDCGTVDCREYFGNVFDYDPHTKVSIYLPFIGVVPLKVSEVMRSTINVTYGVDVITGACLAKVKVTRDGGGAILYSYGGSCACHYPISSGSYAGIISGIVTSAIGIAGGIATGSPLAAIGGAMAGLHQAHTEVQRSGGFTGCAGAMGPKKPYLIIDRPQTKLATNFEVYQGKPANSTQFIGDCAGFVRATEVHFSAPGAFDDEAKEVEALLKSGVILD